MFFKIFATRYKRDLIFPSTRVFFAGMMKFRQAYLFVIAVLLFCCTPLKAEAGARPNFWQQDLEDRGTEAERQVGLASWYGGKFHGRKTASGERYDKHDMTCASRHLPFGTLLEVTNLANGKTAVVRVNDRGPFRKSRVLDLSRAAAEVLGFLGSGVTQVAFTILSPGSSIVD
jgi:rare lipoprotein A (peptidoglycan hydrolase)